jgi:sucrose phosphorylase
MQTKSMGFSGAMLNVYPDSMGRTLGALTDLLGAELKDAFGAVYVLPSLFHHDLDRGFSVIDYGLNEALATEDDLAHLRELGVVLKLDFVLNHASTQSPQFLDVVARGRTSRYADFFIDWNRFWENRGEMTEEGYLHPEDRYLQGMFFRKPGLPLLVVETTGGERIPYWNTFYNARSEAVPGTYLGQMDLNTQSPLVWDFYRETLHTLAGYGANIVRLDAFAYAVKAPGRRNFFNEPETWELLDKLGEIANPLNLRLLPEIHAAYGEGTHRKIAENGYMLYDFFLPGLLLHALENGTARHLHDWFSEVIDHGYQTVNMLGCHDGIPLLDLRGLLPDAEIDALIGTLTERGGRVKDLHGAKNTYYQVNAAYYSALGESPDRLLLSRAIQLFAPGIPQVWYLDLLAGTNGYAAAENAGAGGHKEINRTNYTAEAARAALQQSVVSEQLALLRVYKSCAAFAPGGAIMVQSPDEQTLTIRRTRARAEANLTANLRTGAFRVSVRESGEAVYSLERKGESA